MDTLIDKKQKLRTSGSCANLDAGKIARSLLKTDTQNIQADAITRAMDAIPAQTLDIPKVDISSILIPKNKNISDQELDVGLAFEHFWGDISQHLDLTNSDKLEKIDLIIELCKTYKHELLETVPPLPKPNSDYPVYSTKLNILPLEWLSIHWGQWLTYFNSDLNRDYLFLDQLGKLDPALKKALYAKRRRILSETGCTISEIIPKKSVRIDIELKDSSDTRIKDAHRLYSIPHTRTHRQKRK